MEGFFFKGVWRMDWGLGNPNKTAALIVGLMIGLWALAYMRRWGFWVALAGFTGLGIGLIHTFSRGGFVALICGVAPLLLWAPRPWAARRIVGVVVAVWCIVGFAVYLQAHERLGQGVVRNDPSISNRLDLWKYAPIMMRDAPGGWGFGNSGKAFVDWYQPLDRVESYRTMVNNHLTWLVELGWLGRFLYLACWGAIFVLCWPSAQARWLAIPFGIWLALFVSAIFSSVAEEPWVWVPPGIAMLAVVGWRGRSGLWPKPATWLAPPIVSAFILLLIPIFWERSEIRKVQSAVLVGERAPAIWVVTDEKVLGKNYGRTFRMAQSDVGDLCVGFVGDVEELPNVAGTTVVLTGRFSSSVLRQKLAGAAALRLVNPAVFPQELEEFKNRSEKMTVFIGDFSQSPASQAWAGESNTRRMAGVGDFIPDWPVKLLQEIHATP